MKQRLCKKRLAPFAMSTLIASLPIYAAENAIEISDQPIQIIVPFQTSNQKIELDYKIVNNTNEAIKLSNASLSPTVENTANDVITDVRLEFYGKPGECKTKDNGQSATIPKDGVNNICHIKVAFNPIHPETITKDNQYSYQLTFDFQEIQKDKQTYNTKPFDIHLATGKIQPELARTISVTNECSYPVWLGIQGLEARSKASQHNDSATESSRLSLCETDDDCYPGASCHPSDNTKKCFWNSPTPKDGFKLSANGGSTVISIPSYDNGYHAINTKNEITPYEKQWYGSITARVNCTDSGCEIADCGQTDQACKPGNAFSTPSTVAKFNLLKRKLGRYTKHEDQNENQDTYFVTVVDGISVPTRIKPTEELWGGNDNPSFCGPAGGISPGKPLAPCSWKFAPPPMLTFVQPGDPIKSCQSARDCPDKEACGSFRSPDGSIIAACGKATPYYWSRHAICTQNPAHPACENFDDIMKAEQIDWLKQGCPLAKTTANDNANSVFHCNKNDDKGNNIANYTVTFCPKTDTVNRNQLQPY